MNNDNIRKLGVLHVAITGLLLLFSGFISSEVTAQEESDGNYSITSLPSYFEEQVVDDSQTNQWYKLQADEQWLGWFHTRRRTYEIFEEGAINPDFVEEYTWNGQISFPIVRRSFEEKVRQELEKQDKEISKERLNRIVETRVSSLIQGVGQVLQTRSISSVIYRNKNGTFREAKYVVSRNDGSEIRVYIQHPKGHRDRLVFLIPNQRTFTRAHDPDLEIVNYPLAAKLIQEQFLPEDQEPVTGETLKMRLLAGGKSRPLVPAEAVLQKQEPVSLKLHNDKKIDVWKVHLTIQKSKGPRNMIWFLDRNGVIRNMKIKTGQKESKEDASPPQLEFVWTTKKKARAGIEFVFSREGRRNPFDPMWIMGEKPGERGGSKCQEYNEKKAMNDIRSIISQAAKTENMSAGQKKLSRQISLTEDFSQQKGLINACGTFQVRSNLKDLTSDFQQYINFRSLLARLGKKQIQKARKAFRNQQFDRLDTYANTIQELRDVLPEDINKKWKKELEKKQQIVDTLIKRGQIRTKFHENQPKIRGIIQSSEPRKKQFSFGMKLSDASWEFPFSIVVPQRSGAAVIESKSGQGTVDRARKVGETFSVNSLQNVTLQGVHPETVIFEYKGESIKVPFHQKH